MELAQGLTANSNEGSCRCDENVLKLGDGCTIL